MGRGERERGRGERGKGPGTLFLLQTSHMYCSVSTGILPSIHTMGADASLDSNLSTCTKHVQNLYNACTKHVQTCIIHVRNMYIKCKIHTYLYDTCTNSLYLYDTCIGINIKNSCLCFLKSSCFLVIPNRKTARPTCKLCPTYVFLYSTHTHPHIHVHTHTQSQFILRRANIAPRPLCTKNTVYTYT